MSDNEDTSQRNHSTSWQNEYYSDKKDTIEEARLRWELPMGYTKKNAKYLFREIQKRRKIF